MNEYLRCTKCGRQEKVFMTLTNGDIVTYPGALERFANSHKECGEFTYLKLSDYSEKAAELGREDTRKWLAEVNGVECNES